jgi:hypothetical protein
VLRRTACFDVHGFDRGGELKDAIDKKTATVVERDGRITGYAAAIGSFAHSVARNDQDLMALIAAAPEFTGPGFLLPTRNYEVLAWCLANGLRLVAPMTLVTTGLYNEPAGAYLVCGLLLIQRGRSAYGISKRKVQTVTPPACCHACVSVSRR